MKVLLAAKRRGDVVSLCPSIELSSNVLYQLERVKGELADTQAKCTAIVREIKAWLFLNQQLIKITLFFSLAERNKGLQLFGSDYENRG